MLASLPPTRDCTVEFRVSNGTVCCLILMPGFPFWNAATSLSNVPGSCAFRKVSVALLALPLPPEESFPLLQAASAPTTAAAATRAAAVRRQGRGAPESCRRAARQTIARWAIVPPRTNVGRDGGSCSQFELRHLIEPQRASRNVPRRRAA